MPKNEPTGDALAEKALGIVSGNPAGAVHTAALVLDLDETYADADQDLVARLAARIRSAMPGTGENRFSMLDYADGVANARRSVDIGKLMALDDDAFAAALIWLATDKRETYEDREHCQEDLEPDVYA